MDITSDREVLAATAWGEARNQGSLGMQAVINVIMNRVKLSAVHPHFGDGTVKGACLAPWQFSSWNQADPNRHIMLALSDADEIYESCLGLADDAIADRLSDLTDGATYYQVIGTDAPWSIGRTPCFTLGKHEFYRNIA